MQKSKVTVVIPNYNGIKYIRNCMDSLRRLKEDNTEFALIVVDNASTDGSKEIIKEEYPEAVLVELETNTGFCHAVNLGIRMAETEYVLLLNNDTIVKPGFIEALTQTMDAKEDIFSVSSKMLSMQDENIIDDAGDMYCILGWAFSRGKGKPAEKYSKSLEIFASCAGAALYRKSVFEEIGYFDENHFAYLEDIDIGWRARIYGYRNVYEPKAEVVHAGSAASGSRYNQFKTKLASANNAYIIGKNMPLLQILFNLPFLIIGFLVKVLFFALKGMGVLYVKSYVQGLGRCFSKAGRENKVPYKMKHFLNYLKIQISMIFGVFRILIKY